LLATYIGGMTGGCISAILIGIPGTPSTAATVIDGYPMAKKGQGSLACGTAIVASAFGGLFSLVIMIVSVDVIAQVAIDFGPAEIFALVVFGLSTICGLSERSLLRGLVAGVIGLMLTTIGQDPIDGAARLTFGSTTMLQGINIVVAMVGLFAIPQVINTLTEFYRGGAAQVNPQSVKVELPSWRQLKQNFGVMLRTSGLGTIIGVVPGAHGPVAAFLAYDHVKRFAKDPESFGKGDIRGVIAPECANHAVTGGAMIPMLSLGFPGDPATAIILGGLLIHGIQPGPLLFSQHPEIVYTIYVEIIIGYIMVCIIQLYGVRLFVRTLMVPPHLLAVGILVMCVVGSYAIRNSFLDVYVMLAIGLLGYVLQRAHIPVTPIVLGLVLGGIMERDFRTALLMSEGDPSVFYTSPIAMVFFGLTILIFATHIISQKRGTKPRRQEA
jgi:putative tricarboxylic transport membrane protein